MDDEELLRRARAGSEDAFCELVRLHQGSVRAYLGRFTRRRDQADDLAQEVFVAAYRSLDRYRGESPFRIWLLGMARNQWLAHHRAEQRRRKRETRSLELQLARWQARGLEQESLFEHDRELVALRACLKTLSGTNAELIQAFYFDGVSAVELAKRLGRKASAVRMTLLRVRKGLRGCVEGRLAGGTP